MPLIFPSPFMVTSLNNAPQLTYKSIIEASFQNTNKAI